jgi:apolipoprotein N-acyltransferase
MQVLYGTVPFYQSDPWYVTFGRVVLWVGIPLFIILLLIISIQRKIGKKRKK